MASSRRSRSRRNSASILGKFMFVLPTFFKIIDPKRQAVVLGLFLNSDRDWLRATLSVDSTGQLVDGLAWLARCAIGALPVIRFRLWLDQERGRSKKNRLGSCHVTLTTPPRSMALGLHSDRNRISRPPSESWGACRQWWPATWAPACVVDETTGMSTALSCCCALFSYPR